MNEYNYRVFIVVYNVCIWYVHATELYKRLQEDLNSSFSLPIALTYCERSKRKSNIKQIKG